MNKTRLLCVPAALLLIVFATPALAWPAHCKFGFPKPTGNAGWVAGQFNGNQYCSWTKRVQKKLGGRVRVCSLTLELMGGPQKPCIGRLRLTTKSLEGNNECQEILKKPDNWYFLGTRRVCKY